MDSKKDLKILIVDDQPQLLSGLKKILNQAGYSTLEASSGEEALKVVAEQHPALILLDIVLPGLDGLEVCKILKENPDTADIHIVFISGKRLTEDDISSGLLSGADDYIKRPFDANEMLARVKVQLRLRDAEKRLKNTLSQYHYIVANSPDLIAFLDHQFRYILVNDAYARELNFTADQIIGKHAIDVFGEEVFSAIILPHGERCLQGEQVRFQAWFDYPSSSKKYMDVTYSPYVDDSGEVTGFIVSSRNISNRKTAEEALYKNVRLLETITDNMFDLVSLSDLEGNFTFVGRSHERILGYTTGELIGRNVMDFVHPDDLPQITEKFATLLQTGGLKTAQYRYQHKEGHYLWLETVAEILLDDNMNHEQIIFSTRDITQRILQENQLSSMKKRNQALLDHSPVCHKIVDGGLNLQYMSANGFKMLNLDKHSNVYGKPYPFSFFPERFKEEMTAKLKEVMDTGRTIVMEALARDKNGQDIWLDSSLIPVFNEEDTIEFITVVSADVTQRKEDERERYLLQDQLKQAQKMEAVGNLAGGIAHDFNNILTAIMGYTELSLDDIPKNSNIERNLHEVFRAGRRAKQLVAQILTFARKTDEEIKPTIISHIIKEVIQFIRSSISANIKIEHQIESESLIMANHSQLYQVVLNLCTNAAQAMEHEGGTLEISLKDTFVDKSFSKEHGFVSGNYIKLTISDTGVGIPPDIIHSIFEPYFTTKGLGEGTGMGLAVVHGIIESYGGKITVNSVLGEGATFDVYIPITQKSTIQHITEQQQLPKGDERVLFVDDEEQLVALGSRILEKLGYKVTTLTSSTEALALFKSKPDSFDVVVTDMAMPDITGEKLALEMMKIRQDIPVILWTGYSKKITEKTLQQYGIKALLNKPLVKAELAQTVRKVLDDAPSIEKHLF